MITLLLPLRDCLESSPISCPDSLCAPYFNPEISLVPQLYHRRTCISTLASPAVKGGRFIPETTRALGKRLNVTENDCSLGILAFPHLKKNKKKLRSFILKALWENTIGAGCDSVLVNIVF